MAERDDALKELGRMIMERRESIGMTLETVFDRTKIRPEYLRGIESGNYKDFPELVYIKGFVRTYLKLIGAEDLLDDFNTQLEQKYNPKKQPESRYGKIGRPEKKESSGKHDKNANILGSGSSVPQGFKPASHFWLFLVLFTALTGTAAYVWYAVSYGGLDMRNLKLFNFSGAGGFFSSRETISQDMANVEIETEISADIVSADEPEEIEEPEAEIKPYLEIHAVNDVWLSVAFGNAQPVFRRTLRRDGVMRWDLEAPARVVIGRPTAAQVILNGKDLGIVNPSARRSETYVYNPDGTYQRVNPR